MTQVVTVVRRLAVLLLVVGVLVMHASILEPMPRAMPGTMPAAMAGHALADSVMVRVTIGSAASEAPAPVKPAGCGGGPVCRAVLSAPTRALPPTGTSAVAADSPYVRAVQVIVSSDRSVEPQPPARARLQVWRC